MDQDIRVRQRANELGISDSHKEYYWIAEQSLTAPVPEGWAERPEGFFNLLTEQTQQTHPSLDYYRQLYQILNTDKQTLNEMVPHNLSSSPTVRIVLIPDVLFVDSFVLYCVR